MRRWRLADADWNHWPDGLSDEASWPVMASSGVEGVEVGVYDVADELSPERTALRAQLAVKHALPVVAVLLSLPAERWPEGALTHDPRAVAAQAVGCARACAGLGVKTLGLWPGADPVSAPWNRLVEGVAQVRDALEPTGVRLAVEYKPGTAVATAAEAIKLTADVPGTGVLLDTGHAHAAGEDSAEVIRHLGVRLWHVHLGDAAEGNVDDDLPVGRLHDFTDVVRVLEEIGFDGVAAFDLYGAVSAGWCSGAEAVRESVAHLRTAGFR